MCIGNAVHSPVQENHTKGKGCEDMNMKISIIAPVYKGESMLNSLIQRVQLSVGSITPHYELILVNDHSPDKSWQHIVEYGEKDQRIKGIDLSRNFGQHNAITAGLMYASGDWIVVMDCDLQDRPEEIPNLYAKALEGWDIVFARRLNRKDSYVKRLQSYAFHRVFNWLSGLHTDETIANFGIFKREVIDNFNKMPEKARSFGSLIDYLGFKRTAIEVQHDARAEGKSSYTLSKLVTLSLDIIISNSNKPLKLSIIIGFIMSTISILLAFYNIIAKLVGIITVNGYTTTVFSIWFIGGLLLFVLGIIGIYIGMIFDQVKGRPLFVVRQKVNF